jgi:hypothetical protein
MGTDPGGRESLIMWPGLWRSYWNQDEDLVAIRDVKELAKLPKAEREAWKELWADVAALLKRVEKLTY